MSKVSEVKAISVWEALLLCVRYVHYAPRTLLRAIATLLLAALTRPVLLGVGSACLLLLGVGLYLNAPVMASGYALLLPVFGAVTVSAVTNWGGGATVGNLRTCTVIATADADTTTGNIAHGLPFVPEIGIPIPLLPMGALKAWSWDRVNTDATNTVFVGNNVVGSGNAGIQLLCIFGRLNTMIR